jgi:hypothetical protein
MPLTPSPGAAWESEGAIESAQHPHTAHDLPPISESPTRSRHRLEIIPAADVTVLELLGAGTFGEWGTDGLGRCGGVVANEGLCVR